MIQFDFVQLHVDGTSILFVTLIANENGMISTVLDFCQCEGELTVRRCE